MGNCCCRRSRKEDDFTEGKNAYDRYMEKGNEDELVKALGLFQSALEKCRTSPDESKAHLSVILTTYANALFTRYTKLTQSASDLAKVIELDEEAFKLFENMPDSNEIAPEYEKLLLNLGDAYFSQYKSFVDKESFKKAINKYNALHLNLKVSPQLRRKGTINMATALIKWSEDETEERGARKEKVEQAIDLLKKAKDGLGDEKPPSEDSEELMTFREKCLFNLAIAHNARYTIIKDSGRLKVAISDLNEAIKYNREAREMLLTSRHPELVYCLFDLGQQLFFKYEYLANPDRAKNEMSPARDGLEELREVKEFAREGLRVVSEQKRKTSQLNAIKRDLEDLLQTAEDQNPTNADLLSSD